MNNGERIDLSQVLRNGSPFGIEQIELLNQGLKGAQAGEFRQEIDALQAQADAGDSAESLLLKVGIGSYLLARVRQAEEYLSRVTGNQLGCFYYALVLAGLERHEEAERAFSKAAKLGFDPIECNLRRVGSIRLLARLDEAEKLLRSISANAASRAEYSFQEGCLRADRGDTDGAVEYFERAVDMDPHHSPALFWLAGLNNLHGNDDEAIRLYEQALSAPPLYLGALLNLGLLYEDRQNYNAAAYCFRRILEAHPTHPQARLYLKDIEAAADMYYDEESLRSEARMQHLLNRSVNDFELTVRSRNCLQSMDIQTLGDLTQINEDQLLQGKNFGQTSLDEIRDMMAAYKLRIGQNLHEARAAEPTLFPTATLPQEQAVMNRPIAELDLSVRARKCMVRLGISTIGELMHRTADELLSSRNFGVTSLNEVREKLEENELKLRND